MQRDFDDFFKIMSWFYDQNPFNLPVKMMFLDFTLIDESKIVNCDQAEEIEARI